MSRACCADHGARRSVASRRHANLGRAVARAVEPLEERILFGFVAAGPVDETHFGTTPDQDGGGPGSGDPPFDPICGGGSMPGGGGGGGGGGFGGGLGGQLGGSASSPGGGSRPRKGLSNVAAAEKSSHPVRYADGTPVVASQDLRSDGLGAPWGHGRSWTGQNNQGLNGNGWTTAELPFLSLAASGTGNSVGTYTTGYPARVSAVYGGTAAYSFSVDSGGYTYAPYDGLKIALQHVSGSPALLRLTADDGTVTDFYDVRRDGSGHPIDGSLGTNLSSKYGRFKHSTSANGTTTVEATYDGNGYVTTLTRSDSASGASERLVYTYATVTNDLVSSGSEATLIASVELQRPAGGGGWTAVRRADYAYYTGRYWTGSAWANDANGRLGDLKLAATTDPATKQTLSSLTRSGSTATATLTAHGYHVGDLVVISGADQSEYDGTFVVTSVTSNTFSYALRGQPATTATGTVTANRPIDVSYYRYYKFLGESFENDDGRFGSVPSAESQGPTNDPDTTAGPAGLDTNEFQYANLRFVNSGLKSVVAGAAFARLVANYPDFEAVPDADANAGSDANGDGDAANDSIQAYANNYFEYERWGDHTNNFQSGSTASPSSYIYNSSFITHGLGTRYRVTKEVAQGAGCSTCSGGQGAFKFEYGLRTGVMDRNSWAYRTTEYLPDATPATWADNDRQTIYTNDAGQEMLRELVDVDERAVLATGFSFDFPSARVTVTAVGHGFQTGDEVYLKGTTAGSGQYYNQSTYDGYYTVNRIDDDHYSFAHSFMSFYPSGSSAYAAKVLARYRTYTRYDAGGRVVLAAAPSAVTGYWEGSADLINDPNSPGGNAEGLADNAGLIQTWAYGTSTTATSTTAGDVLGYAKSTGLQQGESGTSVAQWAQAYLERDNGSGLKSYPLASYTQYRNDNGTGGQTTTYAYTFVTGTNQIASSTVTLPTVSTGQNGSGTADTATTVFDAYGRPVWTKDQDGFIHYTEYDDGNRLVAVKNDSSGSPGSTLATYAYDGLHRRVSKATGGHTDDSYFDEQWRVLETRRDGDTDAREQFAWEQTYVDAPAVRFLDANTDGDVADAGDDTLYYLTDANHNVTAVFDAGTQQVTERYMYDPYGKATIYAPDWSATRSTSSVGNSILFAGYVADAETGNYLARNRYYQPTLARWISRDPAGYVDGMSLYEYVGSSPLGRTDSSGLYWSHLHLLMSLLSFGGSGCSLKFAGAAASQSVLQDIGTQGDGIAETRKHAMAGKDEKGKYESAASAKFNNQKYVDEQMELVERSCDTTALGNALHAIQDRYASGHAYQEWRPGGLGLPSFSHVIGDNFPSPGGFGAAVAQGKALVRRFAGHCCGSCPLKIPIPPNLPNQDPDIPGPAGQNAYQDWEERQRQIERP
jgi:RHS repeat-associated protein